jgi:hypothetical protein
MFTGVFRSIVLIISVFSLLIFEVMVRVTGNPNNPQTRTMMNTKGAIFVLLSLIVPINILLLHSYNVSNGLELKPQQTKVIPEVDDPRRDPEYTPASVEDYIITNAKDLGYENPDASQAKGCTIWKSPNASTPENYNHLQEFRKEISAYAQAVTDHNATIAPLMKTMNKKGRGNWADTCKKLRPHPDGIEALFPSKQLSHMNGNGFMEPLLAPMRHPNFCWEGKDLMRLDYIVHDFEAMCMKLKPHSKIVLIDMGASLEFHKEAVVPIMTLLKEYEKFGFQFDHVYAFEVTKTEPDKVYNNLLPAQYFPSYHWINTGVSADPKDKMNPLKSIVAKYTKDDFVVVKLDIDTSHIEVPLAKQLLEDDSLHEIVDQFYFEHHVKLQELARSWGRSMSGTIKDSFDLMNGLRKKGIASHFWV